MSQVLQDKQIIVQLQTLNTLAPLALPLYLSATMYFVVVESIIRPTLDDFLFWGRRAKILWITDKFRVYKGIFETETIKFDQNNCFF